MLEIHLYGNLRAMVQGSSPSEDTVLTCKHETGETFSEFVHRLGLTMTELGDCFINGVLAKPSDVLKDGDRIGLFPFNMVLLCGGQHLKGHGFTRNHIEVDYY